MSYIYKLNGVLFIARRDIFVCDDSLKLLEVLRYLICEHWELAECEYCLNLPTFGNETTATSATTYSNTNTHTFLGHDERYRLITSSGRVNSS